MNKFEKMPDAGAPEVKLEAARSVDERIARFVKEMEGAHKGGNKGLVVGELAGMVRKLLLEAQRTGGVEAAREAGEMIKLRAQESENFLKEYVEKVNENVDEDIAGMESGDISA